jgi:hypothetical protein
MTCNTQIHESYFLDLVHSLIDWLLFCTVTGHVFVCYRSCICVLQVMYLCVTGHVFVCYRSCICVLQVMYLCFTGHVFVCYWSCICVLQVSILPLSTILLLNFGTVPAVWYFYFYFFFFYSINRDCCLWIYWFIFKMDWRILVNFVPRFWLGMKY